MKYKSLADVVEAKRAGTLEEGFRLWLAGDFVNGGVGDEVMLDQILDGAVNDLAKLLGLKVE